MKRSKANLSNYRLMTGDMGKLYPVGCVEALPGDTIRHNTSAVIRVSPLAAPIMHPVTARIHHFFVPNRLVWKQTNGTWEDFITGGDDGTDSQPVPTLTTNTVEGNVQDHLGLPRVAGIEVNAMPVRCYNLIYNEFYRDQDLSTEIGLDGFTIRDIAWEKDYFTAARPFTQKGPDVTLPLGTTAPIQGIGSAISGASTVTSQQVTETDGSTPTYANAYRAFDGASSDLFFEADGVDGDPQLFADLSAATGVNVNEVRRAFAIQRYQEARSRYGSRYTEYLRYLGVTDPKDQRLQRPEYLGGGKVQLNFSEIMQTAPDASTPTGNGYGVGDLYGHGIASMRSNAYQKYIEEHGYIMTMLSIRPKSIYSNGIHRSWLRQDKTDYYQKELELIGQQPITLNEVYADATNGDDVFGYNDRYSEYRSIPSSVAGEFRSTLDYWHMARDFGSAPTLNNDFIKCDATKRIHNVQTEDALWCAIKHKMVARRIVTNNPKPRIL